MASREMGMVVLRNREELDFGLESFNQLEMELRIELDCLPSHAG